MFCPFCGKISSVIDSNRDSYGVRRRRKCPRCKKRFSTRETLLVSSVQVTKDGGRGQEAFNSNKIRRSLQKVCKGRSLINDEKITILTNQIEAYVLSQKNESVHSREIAQVVFELLRELDPVASERFAISYRDHNGELDFGMDNGHDPIFQYSLFD